MSEFIKKILSLVQKLDTYLKLGSESVPLIVHCDRQIALFTD